ncbi:hypothetical protein [Pseudomonas sp. SMV7]|uniref:hypothetical protein n=1 Tax=Pseudomonas sp. SMV7 TaxID=3390194 RepID=UPI003F880030
MSGNTDFKNVAAGTVYDSEKDTLLDGWILRPISKEDRKPVPQVVYSGEPTVGNVLQWTNWWDPREDQLWFLLSGIDSTLEKPLQVKFEVEVLGELPHHVQLNWEKGTDKQEMHTPDRQIYTMTAPVGAQAWEIHKAFALRFYCPGLTTLRISYLQWEYV